MAPRPIEPFAGFCQRLQRTLDAGGTEVRFGRHHWNHAVCVEDGMYRIRKLEATAEECEAFRAKHGYFMPENAEDISKPRTLVFETPSLDALKARLEEAWPW